MSTFFSFGRSKILFEQEFRLRCAPITQRSILKGKPDSSNSLTGGQDFHSTLLHHQRLLRNTKTFHTALIARFISANIMALSGGGHPL